MSSSQSPSLSRLMQSLSSYQQFFYGLTPFAAILLFKFLLQQIKNNQHVIDNSIDIIKIARRRYQSRQVLPRVESSNDAEFILKVDQGKHFKHQVAGHATQVMLKHKDMVLKPMNKLNLFLRELKFYESMASSQPQSSHFPHQFVPRYHGVILGENSCGKRTPYLALTDASKQFKNPCMMDIKMGRETFEPTAPLDKMMREKIKYRHQEKIGFRICGYKVYDSCAQIYHSVGKKFGRNLSPELVEHGLASFFHNGMGHFRLDVLEQLVQKLELLLQWFLKQNKWHFYCSSLLITYDAEVNSSPRVNTGTIPHRHFLQCCLDTLREESIDGNSEAAGGGGAKNSDLKSAAPPPRSKIQRHRISNSRNLSQDIVDVRMIDHAHTLQSPGSNDESYIYSLKSLIYHLELIITNIRAGGDSYSEPSMLIAEALALSQQK
jgi:1D-myo-inositol-tetrakisphosphate 5-kinase/inositol-polyphosphate multikinase